MYAILHNGNVAEAMCKKTNKGTADGITQWLFHTSQVLNVWEHSKWLWLRNLCFQIVEHLEQ